MTTGIPDLYGSGGERTIEFSSMEEAIAWSNRLALRYTGGGTAPSVAARADIADTSRPPAQGQMTVAALDALLPVPYGRVYAGALLANVFTLNDYWVFWVLWGEGPVDSVVNVYLNDAPLPNGSIATNYLGTAAGAVDSTLVACFAAQGITFAETLPYVCHSVIQIPFVSVTAEPRFNAEIKGIPIARLSEAQRNLLTYSNTFTNAAWTSTATVTAGQTGPDALPTGTTLTDASGAAGQSSTQTVSVANDAGVYFASVYVKKTTGGTAPTFGIKVNLTGGTAIDLRARLNTDTGAVDVATGGNVSNANVSVTDFGAWWRFVGKVTNNTSGNTSLAFGIYPATNSYGSLTTDSAAVTGSAVIAWAMLEKAAALTDYQPIVTTYATESAPQWTDSPALILRDFLESARWGPRKTVRSAGVESCLLANATALGTAPNTEAARTCNVMVDREASIDKWVESLRTAAACFLAESQNVVKLVPDIDGTPIVTYAHASGQIIGLSEPELRDSSRMPTVIEVTYTDASAMPYKDATTDPVTRAGVDTGATPYRKSVFEMRWITRRSQAQREATELMNKLWLRSITFQAQMFDEGLRHEPGDLIAYTYPDAGFSALPVRVLNAQPNAMGWQLSCEKHDPGAYSQTVLVGPTTPNTNLPLPNNPPAMSAITLAEDVYAVQTGLYGSRIKVSWTPVDWPFLSYYVITVTQAGALKETGVAQAAESDYLTKALTENLQYLVSVAVVSSTGAIGIAAVATITNSGKSAKPSDMTRFDAYEIGGEVRLSWDPAPVTDLDWTATEIRYGSTSATWATATVLDRIAAPALRYSSNIIGAGTARIFAKYLDSVRSGTYPYGQESVNAIYKDVVVTSDAAAFIAAQQAFSIGPTKNMVASGSSYVTSFAQTWGSIFTLAMSNYPNEIARYHTAGTSGLWTAIIDLGASVTGDFSISGDFQSTMDYSELDGVGATRVMQLNLGGGEAPLTVTGATNATPIVITASHLYNTGEEVVIAGVGGNAAANGRWLVTVVDATHFSLQNFDGTNSVGSGAYTSGGTASRWLWSEYTASVVKTTARYVRQKISTTGTLVVRGLGQVTVNVVTRPDGGNAVVPSATQPTVIKFAQPFTLLQALGVVPQYPARSASYDQVEVSRGVGLQSGRCLRFVGASSQYVTRASLLCGSSVTVECWIKPDAWNTGSAQAFWSTQNDYSGGGASVRYALQVSADGVKVVLSTGDGVTNYFANATTGAWTIQPPVGQWTHIACVMTGAAPAILYYNGVEVGRAQVTKSPASTSTGRSWFVGTAHATGGPFSGCIDAFRVWDEARSAANILANYNLRLTTATNLLLNWNMDETSGTTVSDDSGAGRSGTYTNAPGSNPDKIWRPYDGFDAYIFDSAGAQTTGNLSWSAKGV